MEIRIPFLRWMESASARALFDPFALIERRGWKKWCLWMEDFAGQDRSMVFSGDI